MNDHQRGNANPFSSSRQNDKPGIGNASSRVEPSIGQLTADTADTHEVDLSGRASGVRGGGPVGAAQDHDEDWRQTDRSDQQETPAGGMHGSRHSIDSDEDLAAADRAAEDWRSSDPATGDWDEEAGNWLGGWPLGTLAIAVIALILLVIGGFGVMSERSAMQAQLRDLQSQLTVATAADTQGPQRDSQRKLQARNAILEDQVRTLTRENHELNNTLQTLETKLAAYRNSPVKSEPAPAPAPAPRASAETSAPKGKWFVNFSSYRERDLAQRWADRLQPASGEVVVLAAPSSDLFRVRVVSIADEQTARRIASSLQSEFGLPKPLWVGEE
jgi:cell division septation protein DedD